MSQQEKWKVKLFDTSDDKDTISVLLFYVLAVHILSSITQIILIGLNHASETGRIWVRHSQPQLGFPGVSGLESRPTFQLRKQSRKLKKTPIITNHCERGSASVKDDCFQKETCIFLTPTKPKTLHRST